MRRSALLILFVVLLAAGGSTGRAAAGPVTATNTATTTDLLNLRGGPSLADKILLVMPAGSLVTLTGQRSNGFWPVIYNGRSGWASGDYLRLDQGAPSAAGTAVTTDQLNLRSGSSLGNAVLTVIPRGAVVTLTGQSSNGFRSVSYNGWTGWAHTDYLRVTDLTPSGGAATTLDDLNLRSGPSTGHTVVAVIPLGSTVTLTGQSSNGFRAVSHNGRSGWAFAQYLSFGPEPPDTGAPLPFDVTNPIVGQTRGSAERAIAFATRAGADRLDQVRLYITEIYRLAPRIGFDPAILVAQSAHETGYWKSTWWRERLNPAGLGITGNPQQEAGSATFANGTLAARAQIAHMHAEVFGNSQPLPDVLQGADQSYQAPFRAGWAGTVRAIHDLNGRWAMDSAYDVKVVRLMKEIYG